MSQHHAYRETFVEKLRFIVYHQSHKHQIQHALHIYKDASLMVKIIAQMAIAQITMELRINVLLLKQQFLEEMLKPVGRLLI